MSRPPARLSWVLALCAAGAALNLVPGPAASRWRALVRDALRPGQTAIVAAADWGWSLARGTTTARGSAVRSEEHSSEVARLRDENRRLLVQLATLEQRSARQGAAPVGEASEPLLVPELIEARVLGEESAALWRSRKLVAAGTGDGVIESALVLQDERPLVDLGAAARLSTGDAVYAGRFVVGKIAEAGRFSSSVQLITDAGYSGRARLAHRAARGLTFGTEGTLVGTGGSLCRLKHIAEPVNVGDEVFTGGTDGALPYPMYYGRVVRAELEPGAAEWSIDVQPAAAIDRFDRVQILRLSVSAGRILAN